MKKSLRVLICLCSAGLIATAQAVLNDREARDAKYIVNQISEMVQVLGQNYHVKLTSHQRNRVTRIVSNIANNRRVNFDLINAVMKERKLDDKVSYSTAHFILLSYFVEPAKVSSFKTLQTIKHYEISFLFRRETSKEKSSDWWPWDYKGSKRTFSWWIYPAFIAGLGSSSDLWGYLKEEGIERYLVGRVPAKLEAVRSERMATTYYHATKGQPLTRAGFSCRGSDSDIRPVDSQRNPVSGNEVSLRETSVLFCDNSSI